MFRLRVDADLELGLFEERHADELFALIDQNRPYLRQWMSWVDNTRTPSDVRKFVKRALGQFAEDGAVQAGILHQDRLVGVIGMHPVDRANRSVILGYWLAESAQGKGIMTRVCGRLVDYAFSELGLHRVEIRAATENARSRRIPERLGFLHEGTRRQAEWLYDHFVDLEVYAMLAPDWTSQRGDVSRGEVE